ncbi:MAG: NUDIX hydrolase [Leadbetterella sp.]
MTIYTRDTPIYVVTGKPPNFKESITVDLSYQNIDYKDLSGYVLVKKSDSENVCRFINFLEVKGCESLESICFLVNDLEEVKAELKAFFVYIKAAGGVVQKNGKLLLIKRLGKWDLPKGKAEKGENSYITAIREVEEECGVEVEISKKCCTSWHTYTTKKGINLKRTVWYCMDCISDENMSPQIEEGIEEIRWMDPIEIGQAMMNSYQTIQYVLKKYREI